MRATNEKNMETTTACGRHTYVKPLLTVHQFTLMPVMVTTSPGVGENVSEDNKWTPEARENVDFDSWDE